MCARPYRLSVCLCVCPFTSFTSQLLWVSSSLPFLSHSSNSCLVTAERWKFPIASLSPRMDGLRYLFRLRNEWPNNVCVCVHACVSLCVHCLNQWTTADKSVFVHPVVNRHWRAMCTADELLIQWIKYRQCRLTEIDVCLCGKWDTFLTKPTYHSWSKCSNFMLVVSCSMVDWMLEIACHNSTLTGSVPADCWHDYYFYWYATYKLGPK